jgi:lysophospholipid acyltransferase (LPLAT)-like uncharacterized protein
MPMLAIRDYGGFQAVTSAHKDGNYMQMILEHYGHSAIRGSSRRKATQAMRDILRIKPKEIRLVITPDGPLGPKFKVKGGLVRLAHKFKVPVVPMCYSATRAIVLKTWDRFLVPIPFVSKILIEFGDPVGYKSIGSEADLEVILLAQTKLLDKKCNLKVEY